MNDVIVIGAGVGGLACASRLASNGKQVLVLERIFHLGGSSSIFKRGDFIFPMGPLSFSHPELVKNMLEKVGVSEKIEFSRSHFQFVSPELDIIYSQDWADFKEELKKKFPKESEGIEGFFSELNPLLEAISDIIEWHPDFVMGKKRNQMEKELDKNKEKYNLVEKYYKISSKSLLDKYIKNDTLTRLLGSQGSNEPLMNVVHLAFMWNIMSIQGIWFPSCTINGLNELLAQNIINHGGVIKKNTEVAEILIENNKAVGVKTANGEIYKARWIISNADYKQVFLQLINSKFLPASHVEKVRDTPYTSSELCVYLGIDPSEVELSKMKADHLFYRSKIKPNSSDPTDFENKEIEICLWSNKSEKFAPEGYKSLLLRVNMPYQYFEKWRVGNFKRKEGYAELKQILIDKLIGVVDQILPGLSSSIVQLEAATPLTYRDYICRFNGSVAGWTRDTKKIRMASKLLSEKPIDHLLLVGIYSVVEPFLGGYPVSMYSGCLSADLILERDKS